MALSTMINDTGQTLAAYRRFELSPGDSFGLTENHDIYVPTTAEFKNKIISPLETLLVLLGQSVLVQYWAPKEIGNTFVLTTTCQVFGLSGNNKELESYRKACLDHKLYVHPNKGVAFGLPGLVFLNRTPEQTQNVHKYPKDQRPSCEAAIFKKNWGSFAVPVNDAGKCVGVLEFVMDTPQGSYDNDIGIVCAALENAGFQSSIPTNLPRVTNNIGRKRSRTTNSSEFTSYGCLAQYFGLSSADAAVKLGETTGKRVKRGTFRNACRDVGITEWPWISKHRTSRASSNPESQVIPTTSETSSFEASNTTEYSYYGSSTATDNMSYLSSSVPSRATTTEASFSANGINQIADDASSFPTPHASEGAGPSLSETLIDKIASGDVEPWYVFEGERADFMIHFEEMKYPGIIEDLDVEAMEYS